MLATNILRVDLVSDVSTTSHSWSGSVTLEMMIVLAQSFHFTYRSQHAPGYVYYSLWRG